MNSIPGVVLLSLLAVGCGTDDDGERPGTDGSVGGADATSYPDAGPQPVQMFVHTGTTLYLIDDINFTLTEIGTFDAPENDHMTDLAVTPDGEIYTLSKTALYRVDRDTAQALVFARSIVKRYWQWKSGCIYYCPTELMYIRTLLREFRRAEEKTLIDLE